LSIFIIQFIQFLLVLNRLLFILLSDVERVVRDAAVILRQLSYFLVQPCVRLKPNLGLILALAPNLILWAWLPILYLTVWWSSIL